MLALRLIGLAALLILSAGCQSINVNTDWDTSYDFSKVRSYAWLPRHPNAQLDARLHNSLIDGRVRDAVNTELANKGFRYSTIEGADVLVNYYLGLEQKFDVDTIYTSYGYGYRGWYGPGVGSAQTVVNPYEEGTLMVDVLQAGTKNLLWRGTASTRLGRSSTPEKSKKTIDTAVSRMFKKFPPGQQK